MEPGIDPAEEINLSAAAAAERWASGIEWTELVNRTKAEEGDLVRLLSRTGEALLQIANLKESNPEVAATEGNGDDNTASTRPLSNGISLSAGVGEGFGLVRRLIELSWQIIGL